MDKAFLLITRSLWISEISSLNSSSFHWIVKIVSILLLVKVLWQSLWYFASHAIKSSPAIRLTTVSSSLASAATSRVSCPLKVTICDRCLYFLWYLLTYYTQIPVNRRGCSPRVFMCCYLADYTLGPVNSQAGFFGKEGQVSAWS